MFKRWLSIPSEQSCLLIGPRRSGKTTILKQQYPNLNYTTLDDLDYLDWATQDPKGFIQSLMPSGIIDEIQRLPRLTIAVKHAIDNLGAFFLMTGSSTLGLLDSAADTLAGRINIYSLPPACWGEEFGQPTHNLFGQEAPHLQIKEGNRLLKEAMSFGQFPEVLTCRTKEQKEEVLTRYKNTYFTRDLMQLSNIENLQGLVAIFYHLVQSLGSHLEISNFAREAGVSQPTAKKYLNALEQAQLTFKLHAYHYGPAKRFLKAGKTYFADNGIISAFNVPVGQGPFLENFVIAELEKRRKLGYIQADRFYYYKSAAGHEIDLLFEVQDTLYAIEIKSTTKPAQKDVNNLKNFEPKKKMHVERFLFYLGEQITTVDNVNLIPVGSLYCGK
jgi:predicted AAA+ superfamily ATPase